MEGGVSGIQADNGGCEAWINSEIAAPAPHTPKSGRRGPPSVHREWRGFHALSMPPARRLGRSAADASIISIILFRLKHVSENP